VRRPCNKAWSTVLINNLQVCVIKLVGGTVSNLTIDAMMRKRGSESSVHVSAGLVLGHARLVRWLVGWLLRLVRRLSTSNTTLIDELLNHGAEIVVVVHKLLELVSIVSHALLLEDLGQFGTYDVEAFGVHGIKGSLQSVILLFHLVVISRLLLGRTRLKPHDVHV
jgi:hypothetical protein